MGNLYIVATPIGNLQDITIRAIETLFSVDIIYSEQASKTSLLLSEMEKRYGIVLGLKSKPKLISMNEYEEQNKIPEIVRNLEDGLQIALVSEAGTPLLSDPGFKLVRECYKRNISVVPIPGASSITAALSASPLPTDKFLFMGFLSKSETKKITQLSNIKHSLEYMHTVNINPTIVLFESPHRLKQTLTALKSVVGNIEIILAHELTKIHEEFIKEKLEVLIEKYTKTDPKGEFVILLSYLSKP